MKKFSFLMVVILVICGTTYAGGWGCNPCWSPPVEQAQGQSVGQGYATAGIGFATTAGDVGAGGIQSQPGQQQGQVLCAEETSVRCGWAKQGAKQGVNGYQEQSKSWNGASQYEEAELCNAQGQNGIGMAGQDQASGYAQGQSQPGQTQGQTATATQNQTMVGCGTQVQVQTASGWQSQTK